MVEFNDRGELCDPLEQIRQKGFDIGSTVSENREDVYYIRTCEATAKNKINVGLEPYENKKAIAFK